MFFHKYWNSVQKLRGKRFGSSLVFICARLFDVNVRSLSVVHRTFLSKHMSGATKRVVLIIINPSVNEFINQLANRKGYALCRRPLFGPGGCHLRCLVPPCCHSGGSFRHLGGSPGEPSEKQQGHEASGPRCC